MSKRMLNGITWGHTRGITPLLAAAQRFSELNPDVEIIWKKRTLQEFADKSILELTTSYDLLVIDHPWSGYAADTKCLLPLDEYLPSEYLDEQLKNSVGGSHESYFYNGHQWALAIDAATPAASFRADLFEKSKEVVPDSWNSILAFAKTGRLLLPGVPVDCLMAFYMFCIANGNEPFQSKAAVIDLPTGMKALEQMELLWSACNNIIFEMNPIDVAETMTSSDDYWYCPFAYCYSNYARDGFADNILTYTDLPYFSESQKFRSTIGGTGLAVSALCKHKEPAVRFVQWVASAKCQSTFYVQNGGQPGHGAAWADRNANILCNDFFNNIIPAMKRGFIRPRYNGYLRFQDQAGIPLHNYLRYGGKAVELLNEMNEMYSQSLSVGNENNNAT